MKELYEGFKEMLEGHQEEVKHQKAIFDKEVKALTKDARRYKLQLTHYDEQLELHIKEINKKIKMFKED